MSLNMWSILFILVFSLYIPNVFCSKKVKIRDVEVLTLYKDKFTSYRRSGPIPQLRCVGYTGCVDLPDMVQCINKGFDGNDIQWSCKGNLNSKYKFKSLVVECEGYDYPDDPYILVGSCGLEYSLELASESKHRSYDQFSGPGRNIHKREAQTDFSVLFVVVAMCVIGFIFFKWLPQNASRSESGYRERSAHGPDAPGWRPFGNERDNGSSNEGETRRKEEDTNHGFGSGFMTGTAVGGAMGYIFGNRSANIPRTASFGSNEFFESSNEKECKGYAGTRRR